MTCRSSNTSAGGEARDRPKAVTRKCSADLAPQPCHPERSEGSVVFFCSKQGPDCRSLASLGMTRRMEEWLCQGPPCVLALTEIGLSPPASPGSMDPCSAKFEYSSKQRRKSCGICPLPEERT